MDAVRVERIEVGGWKPPHGLKIELVGNIDKLVDDDIVLVMHEYGREFSAAVSEAFERIFLSRLENGEYRWAKREHVKLRLTIRTKTTPSVGVDPATKTATIEDIEL